MNPNHRGALAEAAIAYEAAKLGIQIYKPVAEHGRCDLVLEIAGKLHRIQCKSASASGEIVRIGLSSNWRTATRSVRRRYSLNEIDFVAAHCPELRRSFLVPAEIVVARGALQLRLAPPKNGQRAAVHYATDYEFSGAVAQLGERLAGSEEARGSSPLSSTSPGADTTTVGAHQFRNLFGHYMERAAAGEQILVTRRGRPAVRLVPA